MQTSIATVSISGTLPEKLAAIAAAGFEGVEIFEQDFLASDFSPAEVGRMVRDAGLTITLFQPFRDFEGLPDPWRARALARAERKFDLMAELGTDLVLICSSVHPEALGGIDRAAADFRALAEIAAPRGIRLGYEALAWGKHVNDHRDAWEIVRRADHPNVGLILDSFHTLARRIDPETIRRIPGDKIFFVQLADAPAIEMDLLYLSRHFRNMPGEGDLDVTGFLRAVWATGYAGPLSLEIFNDQFRAGLPRLVAEDGRRSLIALADRARRAEPSLKVDLPAFAPPAPVEAVEFIEFATGPAEAPALEAFWRSAGFTKLGRHRSKAVQVWRQGGVTLLLNTDPEGFARSAWATHGTLVAEVGLRVADAKAAWARALALGAVPHHEARAAGELEIPAIRGLGGQVLRLIDRQPPLDRLWEVDFDLAPPPRAEAAPALERPDPGALPAAATAAVPDVAAGDPAADLAPESLAPESLAPESLAPKGLGITAVDHLAQTMGYEVMLSGALFYTALFAATKSPMVDVVDPHGLVRSQAVQTGALRVTLNGAEARRTLAGHFLSETFGASVQHLALACDDIFATAKALRARGFPVLRIGANYYRDIEARFGLAPAFVAELQALDILYDEEPGGRFFQLYSETQSGGIFLEILQRDPGYQGYGAPNAPFRIAAQLRGRRPDGLPAG